MCDSIRSEDDECPVSIAIKKAQNKKQNTTEEGTYNTNDMTNSYNQESSPRDKVPAKIQEEPEQ